MSNSSHEENQSHSDNFDHKDTLTEKTPILSVADFNGDGQVDYTDIQDIFLRHKSVDGDDLYHPLYDLNTDGKIDVHDIVRAINTYGDEVPLLDQQIAQATQATMKYYGSGGLEQAIADGYLPFTPEANGHGIHYFNPLLAEEIGNSEQLDIERPVGLNYDAEGNLLAVFYIRMPQRQQPTPENPFGELQIDPSDNFPPASFDSLSTQDWHTHRSAWITGVGNLNSESVYFEEDVPFETIVSRVQQTQFQLFPESDNFYDPQFWMLHGWFHSINPNGTFAITNPDVAPYAPQELGVHGGHNQDHQGDSAPLIAGTDEGEELLGTDEDDRINGFGGDDWIAGGAGDDSIWGSHGNDWLRGDDDNSSEGGDDMVYGGPGKDQISGHVGNDRLFGGTENDQIEGGEGDDLLRGGLGYDILTGNEGADTFVLAAGEGTDIITDLEIEFDTIVLHGGIAQDNISINQLDNNTSLSFNNETLAILSGVNAEDLIAANDDIFLS